MKLFPMYFQLYPSVDQDISPTSDQSERVRYPVQHEK